jgi:small-conductance mechanosensitive channel
VDIEQIVDTIESAWNDTGIEAVRVSGRILQALIVAAIAALLARWVKPTIQRNLGRTGINQNLLVLTSNLAVVAIYLIAFSAILGTFGANWTGVLAVVGAGTIVIGLSLQDLLRSYIAGVYLLLEHPFAVGDRILVRDADGVVEGVGLRTTILRTITGEQVTIPNATIFLEIVTNRSTNRDDRTTVVLSKVDLPLASISGAIGDALAGLTDQGSRPLKIVLLSSTGDGATVSVTAFHPQGANVSAEMLTRLREHFPAADLELDQG